MTSATPRLIGRYVVEATIGRGAMGVIFRAHDPEIDRTVAIKLVANALLEGADAAEFLSRFRREARASGRCAHSNIVAVYDFGTHEGCPFLAMEFVDGVSLQSLLARGRRFSPAEAALLVGQVLDALACAHAVGIVHRDIKPANILVMPDLRVKVADFGIARFGDSDLTQLGDMVGTPSYMSPEQCRGDPVDQRTDLFSAGSVLFELLTGTRAFGGGSVVEVVRRVVDGDMPQLPAAIGNAVPGLGDVLATALAKEPGRRFDSAARMAQALRAACRDVASPHDDSTVIIAAPRMPAPESWTRTEIAAEPLDPTLVSAVERSLTRYVGPIAKTLVRSAVRKASTVDGLYAALAESIASPEERQQFLQGTMRGGAAGSSQVASRSRRQEGPATARSTLPATTSATGSSASLSTTAPQPAGAEQLDRVGRILTGYVGPLARTLVKRAAADGASAGEVWRRVSLHIDGDAERRRFLQEEDRA